MIHSALRRLKKPKQAKIPSVPDHLRVYAIGDIHGRLDLLREMGHKISRDLRGSACEAIAVLLGDYVDRGPQSAAVIEDLVQGVFPVPIIALRGNHEEMLLRFLDDEGTLDTWRKFGGLETLKSYGVSVVDPMRGKGYEIAATSFRCVLPEKHVQFLKRTSLNISFGDYFFCHAGVKPGVALGEQNINDLLWIRDEFLVYTGSFEKIIVHGHTPSLEPQQFSNRINVDTGAYATSKLTALVLEGEHRRFLWTGSK